VNVVMDRGFASKALEGVALMARTAARRRRNLYYAISQHDCGWNYAYIHGDFQFEVVVQAREWLLIFPTRGNSYKI
jgi:hypothetical protein